MKTDLKLGFWYSESAGSTISITVVIEKTFACAKWIIALFSVPLLLDNVKQDGGQCLCLIVWFKQRVLT